MLSKLKKIPFLDNIRISTGDGVLLMEIEERGGRGYLCTLSLVLAIFLDTIENFPLKIVKYITIVLAGCQETHDYALQLTPDGGWLCCYYDKNMTTEIMTVEIEKHMALTRYLTSIISCQLKEK
ncbi:pathogenicity island protein [Yersinia mollaretii]|uniref:pathogenicity island protein n=1 Tax=Yersinia mollaretii TaxID=33060 RepID=UPI0011A54029|nr:pathogenicity island protein [Yersinia mollaretii]